MPLAATRCGRRARDVVTRPFHGVRCVRHGARLPLRGAAGPTTCAEAREAVATLPLEGAAAPLDVAASHRRVVAVAPEEAAALDVVKLRLPGAG